MSSVQTFAFLGLGALVLLAAYELVFVFPLRRELRAEISEHARTFRALRRAEDRLFVRRLEPLTVDELEELLRHSRRHERRRIRRRLAEAHQAHQAHQDHQDHQEGPTP